MFKNKVSRGKAKGENFQNNNKNDIFYFYIVEKVQDRHFILSNNSLQYEIQKITTMVSLSADSFSHNGTFAFSNSTLLHFAKFSNSPRLLSIKDHRATAN